MEEEYNSWFTWSDRLNEYLEIRLEEIKYDDSLNYLEKERKSAYTEWAVGRLWDRLLEICTMEKGFEEASFIALEDFMWDMLSYSICYGRNKNNKTAELIFDSAVEVAEDIGTYYLRPEIREIAERSK